MIIRFKKLHPDAVTPAYSRDGDAAVDLTAVSLHNDELGFLVYDTGIAVEIPQGYVGILYPRSGISKTDLMLSNSVGIIDSNYRGSLQFKFTTNHVGSTKMHHNAIVSLTGHDSVLANFNIFNVGDRIGQLILHKIPEMSFVEVSELTPSNRGAAGFGSSGV